MFRGARPWPGVWRAHLGGGRRGASCRERCHSCRRPPRRGEAGVQAAGSSEGRTWVLCQREGTWPGRSALGREIDAPGQTSAVTLGPRLWQLPNPVPAARLPASPEPRDSVEARRGRGRARASCRRAWDGQPESKALLPAQGAQAWGRCPSHLLPAAPPHLGALSPRRCTGVPKSERGARPGLTGPWTPGSPTHPCAQHRSGEETAQSSSRSPHRVHLDPLLCAILPVPRGPAPFLISRPTSHTSFFWKEVRHRAT